MRTSLVDSEKTFSGLTDACAAAGKAGCKLIEFTGDGASGDDVKALLTNAHDVIDFFPRPVDRGLLCFRLISLPSSSIAGESSFPWNPVS